MGPGMIETLIDWYIKLQKKKKTFLIMVHLIYYLVLIISFNNRIIKSISIQEETLHRHIHL